MTDKKENIWIRNLGSYSSNDSTNEEKRGFWRRINSPMTDRQRNVLFILGFGGFGLDGIFTYLSTGKFPMLQALSIILGIVSIVFMLLKHKQKDNSSEK